MRRPLLAMCFCQVIGIILALYTEMTIWQLCLGICLAMLLLESAGKIRRCRERKAAGGSAGSNAAAGSVAGSNVAAESATGGNVAEGSAADGNATGGNVAEGSAADGNAAGGNVAEGSTADGNATGGNVAEGSAADGNASAGNVAEGGSVVGNIKYIAKSERKRRGRVALLCVLFLLLGFARMDAARHDDGAFKGEAGNVVTLEGMVISAKVKNGYSQITVKVQATEPDNEVSKDKSTAEHRWGSMSAERKKTERVLVRLDTEEIGYVYSLPGRVCRFQGEISIPDGRRNPGCFDYAQYLKARKVHVICSVSRFRFDGGKVKNGVLNWVYSLKGKFFIAAHKALPEADFGVLAGLMFGDRDFMDEEEYAEFQENGIAHVLAVSGLHVTMVYELIIRLLGGKRSWRTTSLMLVSLFAYAALANFSVSVMRAALMICIRLLAFHLKRRYDLVSAASLAGIILTTISPYQLLDSGFQLSFIAAYTMGICLPWATVKVQALADKYRKEWISKVGDAVLPAVLIQLGMTPLTMFHFCLFSPIAILLNPFAIFLAGLILAAGLAMFVIFALLGDGLLFAGAAGPAQWLCRGLAALSAAGARAAGGFAAAAPPLTAVVVYYLLMFFFFSETRYVLCRRKLNSVTLTLALLLAAAGCVVPYTLNLTTSPLPWKYNDYPVVFLDVGQGDSIHIRIDGKNILVDGGGSWGTDIAKRTLKPYLLKNACSKLDLAIVTHSDGDHSRGIQQLSERMEIDCIAFPACYEGDEERLSPYTTENRVFMSCGDELRISDDAFIRVLAPSRDMKTPSGDENDNCLVLVLHYKGLKVLLTSDLPESGELRLLRQYPELIDCDIIKLAHHGSSTSSCKAFLDAVSPSFAVISVGKNNSYGHPHASVIDLLQKSYIIYGRTDQSGALCLASVTENDYVIVNAAKDRRWLIPRETNRQESTPPRQ